MKSEIRTVVNRECIQFLKSVQNKKCFYFNTNLLRCNTVFKISAELNLSYYYFLFFTNTLRKVIQLIRKMDLEFIHKADKLIAWFICD